MYRAMETASLRQVRQPSWPACAPLDAVFRTAPQLASRRFNRGSANDFEHAEELSRPSNEVFASTKWHIFHIAAVYEFAEPQPPTSAMEDWLGQLVSQTAARHVKIYCFLIIYYHSMVSTSCATRILKGIPHETSSRQRLQRFHLPSSPLCS